MSYKLLSSLLPVDIVNKVLDYTINDSLISHAYKILVGVKIKFIDNEYRLCKTSVQYWYFRFIKSTRFHCNGWLAFSQNKWIYNYPDIYILFISKIIKNVKKYTTLSINTEYIDMADKYINENTVPTSCEDCRNSSPYCTQCDACHCKNLIHCKGYEILKNIGLINNK